MSCILKVSIIIPVYGVEKYIAQCIESVISQDYENKEIILVDDGSPDKSPMICDRYVDEYEYIKVIHKENGGLADARNCGIQHANGDYVLFLDGDDYWDDYHAISTLVERATKTNADVISYSYKKCYEDTGEVEHYFRNKEAMPSNLNRKKQMEYLALNHLYIASACNKMIKRCVLTDEMMFETGVYSEDVEWSARLLNNVTTVDYFDIDFYCYRQRKDSIRHTITNKKCNDLCKHIIACCMMLDKCDEDTKDLLSYYAAFQFATFFMVQAQTDDFQNECMEKLMGYKSILNSHYGNKKIMMLQVACQLIGYKNLCRLIRRIYRKKG